MVHVARVIEAEAVTFTSAIIRWSATQLQMSGSYGEGSYNGNLHDLRWSTTAFHNGSPGTPSIPFVQNSPSMRVRALSMCAAMACRASRGSRCSMAARILPWAIQRGSFWAARISSRCTYSRISFSCAITRWLEVICARRR